MFLYVKNIMFVMRVRRSGRIRLKGVTPLNRNRLTGDAHRRFFDRRSRLEDRSLRPVTEAPGKCACSFERILSCVRDFPRQPGYQHTLSSVQWPSSSGHWFRNGSGWA